MPQASGFQIIDVDGVGEIEVPDDATDQEIQAIIKQHGQAESSPLDFGRDVIRGAVGQGSNILGGFKQIGGAALDIGRNAVTQPSTIPAMLKGFGTGAVEGAKQFVTNPVESQEAFTGIHAAGDQSIGEKVGATGTNILAMLAPLGIARGMKAVGRGATAGAEAGAAGSRVLRGAGAVDATAPRPRLVPRGAGSSLEDVLTQTLNDIRREAPPTAGRSLPSDKPVRGGSHGRGELSEESAARVAAQNRGPVIEPESTPVVPEEVSAPAPTIEAGDTAPSLEDRLMAIIADDPNRPTPTAAPPIDLEQFMDRVKQANTRNPSRVSQEAAEFRVGENARLRGTDEDIAHMSPEAKAMEMERRSITSEEMNQGRRSTDMLESSDDMAPRLRGDRRPTLEELRDSGGSGRALMDPRVQNAFEEVGLPTKGKPGQAAVKDLTGGPSRTPLDASNAELDNEFMRHIMDERGSIEFGPKWSELKKMFGFGPDTDITPIKKDPLALKEGSMDRRNFLYRASGTPTKLVKQRIKETLQNPYADVDPEEVARLTAALDDATERGAWDETDFSDDIVELLRKASKPLEDATNIAEKKGMVGDEWYDDWDIGADKYNEAKIAGGIEPNFAKLIDAASEQIPRELDDVQDLSMMSKLKNALEEKPGYIGQGIKDSAEQAGSPLIDALKGRAAKRSETVEANANPKTDTLFHVAANDALDAIRSEGLKPGASGKVHLTRDPSDARGIKRQRETAGEGEFERGKPHSILEAKIPASEIESQLSSSGDPMNMIEMDHVSPDRLKRRPPGVGDELLPEDTTLEGTLRRLIHDESGGVAWDGVKKGAGLANQVRVASMLSGLAPFKSLGGNIGAVGTAAAEQGSTAPFKELFNFPANIAEAKSAWRGGSNPAGISGSGKLNIPGRVMGTLDQTTQKLLERAGLSPDEASRLLLTRQNKAGKAMGIDNPVGRAIWPFQKTPFNTVKEGFSKENWTDGTNKRPATKGGSARRTALTIGSALAGEQLGENTNDPRILGLAAALMGPRGIPMLMGAAAGGAGRNAISGISPMPEWGIPSDINGLIRLTGVEPAFLRAFGPRTTGGGRKGRQDNKRSERKERR